jgi:hypothetical protein
MSYPVNRFRRRNFDVSVAANTYAGELALPIMSAALKSNDTIAKNYVRVMDGIHHKAVIQTLNANDTIQAAGCDYADGEDLTLSERVLTLIDLKVNETICRKTIYPTWQGTATSRVSSNLMTQEFVNYTLQLTAAKTAENLETLIWQGSAVFTKGFLCNDGTALATLTKAKVDVSAVSGYTGVDIDSITNANAIAQFNSVYTKAATSKPAILSKPNLAFYVSPKTYALYCQQLAGLGAGNANSLLGINNLATAQSFNNVTFMGIKINVCPGMYDDFIMLTYEDNLIVGTNLGTDLNEVRWIPAYEYDGSDNVKIVMQMAVGVQTVTPADIVLGFTLFA